MNENIDEIINYASFFNRLYAWIWDIFVVFLPISLISVLILDLRSTDFSTLFNLSVFYLYNFISVSLFGRTLGKRIMKLRILKKDKSAISAKDAFIREIIGKFISSLAFNVGYLWVFIDRDRQAWHDKIANTVVVKD